MADEAGIPLQHGYNGRLTSKQAGTVGGKIGSSMVKELVRIAQQRMMEK